MKSKYVIGDESFPTKKALIERVQGILHKYKPFVALDGEDFSFVLALLENHPNKEMKVGCGAKVIYTKLNDVYRNKEFVIHRLDDTHEAFSFNQCINPSTHKQKVISALRMAVESQIQAFKCEYFSANDIRVCEVTGKILVPDNCHVDHKLPYTFKSLSMGWMESRQLKFEQILVENAPDGTRILISDKELRQDWQAYHRENCVLRVVTAEANLGILKRKSSQMCA